MTTASIVSWKRTFNVQHVSCSNCDSSVIGQYWLRPHFIHGEQVRHNIRRRGRHFQIDGWVDDAGLVSNHCKFCAFDILISFARDSCRNLKDADTNHLTR